MQYIISGDDQAEFDRISSVIQSKTSVASSLWRETSTLGDTVPAEAILILIQNSPESLRLIYLLKELQERKGKFTPTVLLTKGLSNEAAQIVSNLDSNI